MASNIGTQRVPFECPESYDLLCVGEAPGGEEEGQGRVFVGRTGQLLRRYLQRNNVSLSQTKIGFANLSQFRPRHNRFEFLLNSPQLEEGLNKLEKEIERANPNCILALGGWPMWFLTGASTRKNKKAIPGSGVLLYRGSRLPALPRFGGRKVFVTTHPSYVERVWSWNPVFNIDIGHALKDSLFPELRYPEYDEWINPDPIELQSLVHRSLSSDLISLDIETFPGGRFSCVGWAFQDSDKPTAVCITFQRQDLWHYSKEIWECPTPKILQYATYDIPFMKKFYSWRIGGFYGGRGWDTYVASASILPDYPRGLDFLTSIYTRFPYYKSERKVWKEKADMNILWKYNCKDTVATLLIGLEQMKEIPQLFPGKVAA